MLNVGPGELLAICVVALIVLGPDKLPQALRTVGRVTSELRRMSSGFQDELRSAMVMDETLEDRRRPAPRHRDGEDAVPEPGVDRDGDRDSDAQPDRERHAGSGRGDEGGSQPGPGSNGAGSDRTGSDGPRTGDGSALDAAGDQRATS